MSFHFLGDSSLYLKRNLKEVLPRALNEVCQRRPPDPIEFLARCLYKAADCDLYFQEKAVFETEKRLLGVKLKKEGLQRQNAMARYNKQILELQQFLHAFNRRGTSPRKLPVKQTGRHRKHYRSASIVKKEDRRRTKISFMESGGFLQSFDYSSLGDTSSETETSSSESPKISIEADTTRVTRRSILRKATLPPTETHSIVSVHKESVSSSRTIEDEVLERSPSTLTTSSRTTSRRVSVSYGDEGEVKEDLRDQEAELKLKRKSRVRRTPPVRDETDGAKHVRQKSRRQSQGKEPKDESSIIDVLISPAGIESVSQIIGGFERAESLKEQTAKKKRKRKIKIEVQEEHTTADVSSTSESGMSLTEPTKEQKYTLAVPKSDLTMRVSRSETAEEIILEDIQEELERQASLDIAVDVKEKSKGHKASMKRASFDRKRSRKADTRVDSLEPSRKKDFERSGEASLEPSGETSSEEDEFEAQARELDYERYITEDTDSVYETQFEEVTDHDFTYRRSVKPKLKKLPKAKKKSHTAATDTEDARSDQTGKGTRRISKREMKFVDEEEATDTEDARSNQKGKGTRRISKREMKFVDEEEATDTEDAPSDQKGKGTRRISKREMKFVDEEEAEQIQMRMSLTTEVSEMLTNEPEEVVEEDEKKEQVMEVKQKRKKKVEKRKQHLIPKETPEDDEGAAEDEQYEDNTASRKFSKRMSNITDIGRRDSRQRGSTSDSVADTETKKRRRRRRRKSGGKIYDDEDQEEPKGTSQTQLSTPRQSTETSADDFPRDRTNVAKTGTRRGKASTSSVRRRSFSKTLRSKSHVESERMPSDQFSEILLSEYPEDAETSPETSVRPSEIEQIAETTEEPYSYPFTPVECEWLLIDSHTLVCRHPVLGDIRSRPTTISNALDFTGWSDRRNYNWRAFYDHEMYTVKDPYLDDAKFKRRLKGP